MINFGGRKRQAAAPVVEPMALAQAIGEVLPDGTTRPFPHNQRRRLPENDPLVMALRDQVKALLLEAATLPAPLVSMSVHLLGRLSPEQLVEASFTVQAFAHRLKEIHDAHPNNAE
jgi:hypothetical protein